jgi:hypothetical protein
MQSSLGGSFAALSSNGLRHSTLEARRGSQYCGTWITNTASLLCPNSMPCRLQQKPALLASRADAAMLQTRAISRGRTPSTSSCARMQNRWEAHCAARRVRIFIALQRGSLSIGLAFVQALFQLLTEGKHRLVVAPEYLSPSFKERIAPSTHHGSHGSHGR